MKFTLEVSRPALKSLKKIPKMDLVKIQRKMEGLALNPFPRGFKKIVGDDNLYRIRAGDYRILYRVYNNRLIIYVVDVGHRKKVYAQI